MADVCKETKFHVVDFLVLGRFLFYLLHPEFLTLPFQYGRIYPDQDTQHQDCVENESPYRQPERRMDHNPEFGNVRTCITVTIHRFYLQYIISRRKAGKSYPMFPLWKCHPFLMKTFQLIDKLGLLRQNQVICRKGDLEDMLMIRQIHFTDKVQGLFQNDFSIILLTYRDRLIHQLQGSKQDFRYQPVIMHPLRIERIESVESTGQYRTVLQTLHGTQVKIAGLQSVVIVIFPGFETIPLIVTQDLDVDNPVGYRNPDVSAGVLGNRRNRLSGQFRHLRESDHLSTFVIKSGKPFACRYPKPLPAILVEFVHTDPSQSFQRPNPTGRQIHHLNTFRSTSYQQRLSIPKTQSRQVIVFQAGIVLPVCVKLSSPGVQALQPVTQSRYPDASIRIFLQIPDTIIGQSIGGIGFPVNGSPASIDTDQSSPESTDPDLTVSRNEYRNNRIGFKISVVRIKIFLCMLARIPDNQSIVIGS